MSERAEAKEAATYRERGRSRFGRRHKHCISPRQPEAAAALGRLEIDNSLQEIRDMKVKTSVKAAQYFDNHVIAILDSTVKT